jgi:hypothetical protein
MCEDGQMQTRFILCTCSAAARSPDCCPTWNRPRDEHGVCRCIFGAATLVASAIDPRAIRGPGGSLGRVERSLGKGKERAKKRGLSVRGRASSGAGSGNVWRWPCCLFSSLGHVLSLQNCPACQHAHSSSVNTHVVVLEVRPSIVQLNSPMFDTTKLPET